MSSGDQLSPDYDELTRLKTELEAERERNGALHAKLVSAMYGGLEEKDALNVMKSIEARALKDAGEKLEAKIQQLTADNERLKNLVGRANEMIADHDRYRRFSDARTNRLMDAITNHRDQRGDDRCWLDDKELYKELGGNLENTALPPLNEFLPNCIKFHTSRQNPDHEYMTRVEELKRERDRALEQAAAKAKEFIKNWGKDDHAGLIALSALPDELLKLKGKTKDHKLYAEMAP